VSNIEIENKLCLWKRSLHYWQ